MQNQKIAFDTEPVKVVNIKLIKMSLQYKKCYILLR